MDVVDKLFKPVCITCHEEVCKQRENIGRCDIGNGDFIAAGTTIEGDGLLPIPYCHVCFCQEDGTLKCNVRAEFDYTIPDYMPGDGTLSTQRCPVVQECRKGAAWDYKVGKCVPITCEAMPCKKNGNVCKATYNDKCTSKLCPQFTCERPNHEPECIAKDNELSLYCCTDGSRNCIVVVERQKEVEHRLKNRKVAKRKLTAEEEAAQAKGNLDAAELEALDERINHVTEQIEGLEATLQKAQEESDMAGVVLCKYKEIQTNYHDFVTNVKIGNKPRVERPCWFELLRISTYIPSYMIANSDAKFHHQQPFVEKEDTLEKGKGGTSNDYYPAKQTRTRVLTDEDLVSNLDKDCVTNLIEQYVK